MKHLPHLPSLLTLLPLTLAPIATAQVTLKAQPHQITHVEDQQGLHARDLERKPAPVRPTFEGDMVRSQPDPRLTHPILVLPFAGIQSVSAHQLRELLEQRRARPAAPALAPLTGGVTPLPLEAQPLEEEQIQRREPSLRIVQIGDALFCPCGNDAKVGGCVNSTGMSARLRAVGSTAARTDDLELLVEGLPPRAIATLVMGSNAIQRPFGDGLLMVHNGGAVGAVLGNLVRFPVKTARNDGAIAFGPGLAHYAAEHFAERDAIQAGEVRFFQVIYRDAQGPCGLGMNATNALAVSFE